jgi:hypothetical protein
VRHVNLVQLYEDNREKLLLNWHIGQNADRRIEIKGSNSYGADLVGHINIIHPERLQVLGLAEYDWAMRIGNAASGRCSPTCSVPSRPPSSSPMADPAAHGGGNMRPERHPADLLAQALLCSHRPDTNLSVGPSG